MLSERRIVIREGGDLDLADVHRAIDDTLARLVGPGGPTRLEGREALLLDVNESGALLIRRLVQRTEDGLRVAFEGQWIVLPEPPRTGREPVAVAVLWELRPVRDGSVVECGVPVLVRIPPAEVAQRSDALMLGFLGPDGFEAVPASGDRLDGCQPLHEWAARLRDRLAEFESLLTSIAVRLTRQGAPVLVWDVLLSPITGALADAAASLADDEHPSHTVRRLGLFLAELDDLPVRTRAIGDPHLIALIEQAGFPRAEVVPACEALHEQCGRLEQRAHDRLESLNKLGQLLGIRLKELPSGFYHGGRMYRRIGRGCLRRSSSNGPARYRVEPDLASNRAALAVLWDLSTSEIRLGDVRFDPPATAGNRSRGQELYLGPLQGEGYHWIEGQPLDGSTLCVDSDAPILDSACYEPLG